MPHRLTAAVAVTFALAGPSAMAQSNGQADDSVRVIPRLDRAEGRAATDEIEVSLFGGYARTESPRGGYGANVTGGGAERFLVDSERRLDGLEFGGRIRWTAPPQFCRLHGDKPIVNWLSPPSGEASRGLYLFLDGRYGNADGSNGATDP